MSSLAQMPGALLWCCNVIVLCMQRGGHYGHFVQQLLLGPLEALPSGGLRSTQPAGA